jgi:DNA-binding NarL/FixJ family response regulator
VRLARECPADVVVMDVRMPGLGGVVATREICQAADRPRVLILTTFDLDEYAFAALRAGAQSVPPCSHAEAAAAVDDDALAGDEPGAF